MVIQLYYKLFYPYNTDFIWMIQNNHIKNYDILFRDIDVVKEIWGKDIDALKVNTTQNT